MIPYNIQTKICKSLHVLVFVLMYCALAAQQDSLAIPTPPIPDADSLTVFPVPDTIPPIFSPPEASPLLKVIDFELSADSLDFPVEYTASDSMIYDIENEIVYLFGNAEVKYEEMSLKAGYIEFNWKTNIASAEGITDSLGNRIGNPVFEDNTQSFTAKKLDYNFKTEKGKVYDVRTQEGDGFLLAGQTKFFRKNLGVDGQNDVAYSGEVIYTTCNHSEPHFGVHSKRAKIIPNKLIVVGPSNVHIGGVPTPLMLPFGFFPITKGQRSGLVFPRDFESSPTLGFGLRNVGYYFGISDYFDLTLTGDIYTRGSWGVTARSNYNRRYKFRGGFSVSFSNRRFGQKGTPDFSRDRDFLITLNHSQARQAHPTRTISANMTFGTGSYLSNNRNDATSVLTNTLSSNVSLSKSFPGKPISLSTSFSHSQNTNTRIMNISFPVVDFRMNQIFPFQRKKVSSGKEGWYEKIGFSYTGRAENRVSIADTLLFTSAVFDELRYGVEHNIPVSASFKLFKWFNISPSVRYLERWYLETLEKEFDPTLLIENDTIFSSTDPPEIDRIDRDTTFGSVVEREIFGFKSQRQVTASVSLSTQLYGQMGFGGGRAIRHVVKPSVSFTVSPDYTKDFWGYFDSVRVDTRTLDKEIYSIFDNGIYSVPSRNRQASLSYSIGNTLEAKVRNRKDSINNLKKIKLINSLTIRGSYNFAADSLKASTVSISGNTTFFKVINANMSLVYDPYTVDDNGRRINVTEWKANRRLARFRSANFTLTTRLNPNDIQELFRRNDGSQNNQQNNRGQSNRGGINSLNINYNLRLTNVFENGKDTIKITTNSLTLRGTSVNLTRNWRIRIGNIGYDFVNKRVTYPDFGFYRDLHCWEMGLDWQPERRTYSFFIRVKPSSLDFLNIPYRRNQVDPFGF
ncbi:MAG: putative LPS assembly protein LptD [Bacteroidota bacterium]